MDSVHSIETGESVADTPSQHFTESTQGNVEKCNKPIAKLYLEKGRINVEFKISTGAEASVISTQILNKMFPRPKVIPTVDIHKSYSGEPLEVTSIHHLDVQYKDRKP
ncbi:hypothetical protein QYM36_000163 [Artemia franciscana]|uniref:Uncharacterized protein n=1 Tax=Artemia franciscana TaxID=6661 RepID=A0AA88IBQ2_ARTSF|nr:hypothetical protein QYM36_000163 [Artemia franciscana]